MDRWPLHARIARLAPGDRSVARVLAVATAPLAPRDLAAVADVGPAARPAITERLDAAGLRTPGVAATIPADERERLHRALAGVQDAPEHLLATRPAGDAATSA